MVDDLIIGEYYYYAKNKEKFKCVKIGDEQSVFIDRHDFKYAFYNNDIYNFPYGLLKERKRKIKKIYENMVD